MTRIAVVGGGRAATLHAEAVRAANAAELVGVGGRTPGTAGPLAAAVDTPDLPLAELVARAEAVVVAVPPTAVADVVAAVPAGLPMLVESPIGIDPHPDLVDRPLAMTGVNLLHAPVVGQALRAIVDLGSVGHLTVRMRLPRPAWGDHGTSRFGGVLLDPGAHLLPVLLAAAAEPVIGLDAALDDPALPTHADLTLHLAGGGTATASLAWAEGPTTADLEAAGPHGVVALELWPVPTLELDGRPVGGVDSASPLAALGFVDQIERLAATARGEAAAWPPIAVGEGVRRIATAATVAARTGRFCRLD